jgi:hypothetical protein
MGFSGKEFKVVDQTEAAQLACKKRSRNFRLPRELKSTLL